MFGLGMRTCDYCGHKVSRDAYRCPHCRNNPRKSVDVADEKESNREYRCRKCGTKLVFHDYVWEESTENGETVTVTGDNTADVRTNYSFYYVYKPCPECGDPQPLFLFTETIYSSIAMFAMQGLMLASMACWAWYIPTLWKILTGVVFHFDFEVLTTFPRTLLTTTPVTIAMFYITRWANQGPAKGRRWIVILAPVAYIMFYNFLIRG